MNVHLTRTRAVLTAVGLLLAVGAPTAYATLEDGTGRGQWRDAGGTIGKERSYELILLYPVARAGASDRKIEEIRRAYEKAFGQESVGKVDDRARVDF
jgi:hypothetical protein